MHGNLQAAAVGFSGYPDLVVGAPTPTSFLGSAGGVVRVQDCGHTEQHLG